MFGATEQQLEEARDAFRQRDRAAVFEVWPENWRAFELFDALESQWIIVAGAGGVFYQGINYSALDHVERRMPPAPGDDVPEPRELFAQLRLLEREARHHRNSSRG